MKNVFYLLLLLIGIFSNSQCWSQIQINTNFIGNSGLSLFEINDISLFNSTSSNVNCNFELRIIDKENNENVLFETTQLNLFPGLNLILQSSFTFQYFENPISQNFKSNNLLTHGIYDICIFLKTDLNSENPIKQCEQINLSNIHEIHLLAPLNNEKIETLNPLLQWVSTFESGTKYHLRVTELYPYKSPEEALGENPSLLDYDAYDFMCFYPYSSPLLQFNKEYAWQVFALSEKDQILGFSESWIFSPQKKEINSKVKNDCYRLIYKQLNNGNYLYGDKIKFGYMNKSFDNDLNYSIMDLTTGKFEKNIPSIVLNPGLNKIDIPLHDLQGIKAGHQYILEIENKSNEKYQLTFVIMNKKN